MAGATKDGPNQSLIDDPNFISYLDDLDRGLRTNNRASDEEELPLDGSPASPDDPNFRSNLEALDRGLSDNGVSHQRAASPAIVPQPRHQPAVTAKPIAPSRAPAARSAPGPSATEAGGRPLLDLFPVEPGKATRAIPLPTAQPRAGRFGRDLSDAPMPKFSDEPVYDADLSSDSTVGDDDDSESGAPFKRTSFVAFMVVMMLLGASIGALVFHARVSRIIVQWQSVSTSVPAPAAAHPSPD